MTVIEGIGDEVVLVVGTFIAFVCMTLAWFSTQVRDRPRPEVVVLDRNRVFRALQRIRSATTNTPTQTQVGYVIRPSSSGESATNADTGETAQTSNSDSPDGNEVSVLYAEVRTSESDVLQTSTSPSINPPEPQTQSDATPEVVHDVNADRIVTAETKTAGSEVRQRSVNTGSVQPEEQDTHSSSPTSENTAHTSAPTSENTADTSESTSENTAEIPDNDRLDGHIRVRLKYLDERQRYVQTRPQSTVEQFKRLFFDTETSENTSVRLIFNGQELRGDRTLQSYNVEDRCVIHCLLSRSPLPERNNTVEQGIPFDMGNLVFPLFGLILGLIWYCRVMYRAYFNPMSTFSLIGITFLYVVALMASFRPNRNHEHVH